MSDKEPTITINEIEYKVSDLSDAAKANITNIQLVDQKISQAQQELAILQTARNAYSIALGEALPARD